MKFNQHLNESEHLKLYNEHEHLAAHYAKKIFNYERFGYEFEDIVQELRIKISQSIHTHMRKTKEYEVEKRYKPIPLSYYLKCAMSNRVKDFIKVFNSERVENVEKISIEDDSFDLGYYSTANSTIDLNKCNCEINGVDLFHGLTIKRQRIIFALYLKGYDKRKLKRSFSMKDDQLSFIDSQVAYLQTRKKDLYDMGVSVFKSYEISE